MADRRIRLDASPRPRAARAGPSGPSGPSGGAADLACIARDPEAFEGFYRRNVASITRFMARRVSDPHAVADLTADVFVSVIRSAHAYQPDRGTELAWLYGIARNVIAGERRRSAHEQRTAGRIAGRRLLEEDDIGRLEDRIDAEGAVRSLYQALTGLPEDERAVLELVAVDGLAVKDAAAALGIRPGTARVRLFRARRAAREALGRSAGAAMPPARKEPR